MGNEKILKNILHSLNLFYPDPFIAKYAHNLPTEVLSEVTSFADIHTLAAEGKSQFPFP